MASSAVGSSEKGTSSPTIGRTSPRGDELEDLGVERFGIGAREEVRARSLLHRDRVVDVGEADADEREVAEQDRARHQAALVLGLDAGREPCEHVPAVERHAAEGAGRDLTADGVERDVDAAPARRLERGGDEVGRARCRRRRRPRAPERRTGPSRVSPPARSHGRRPPGPAAPRRIRPRRRRRGSAPSRRGCTPARRKSDSAARWKGMRTAAAPGSGTHSGMGKVMAAGATATSA